MRGRFDAITEITIEVVVQIPFKEIGFFVFLCEIKCQDGFFSFARVRSGELLLAVEEVLFGNLNGDAGPALDLSPLQILDERAGKAAEIDPRIFPEGTILQRNCGVDQVWADLVEGDVSAVTTKRPGIDRFVEQVLSRAIVDLNRLEAFLLGDDDAGVGEVASKIVVDAASHGGSTRRAAQDQADEKDNRNGGNANDFLPDWSASFFGAASFAAAEKNTGGSIH